MAEQIGALQNRDSRTALSYSGGIGWRDDLEFTAPVDGEDVIYVLEQWVRLGGAAHRALKAFRPNPSRFPGLYIVPEQAMTDFLDKPDGIDGPLATDEQKTQWLRDTVAVLKQADIGDGMRLLQLVGRDVVRIPTIQEIKDNSWRPGDGHYTVCSSDGREILPKKKVGTALIMGPSRLRTSEGEFHYCQPIKDGKGTVGGLAYVGFDPRKTFMLGPRQNDDETVHGNVFVYIVQILVHELSHLASKLLGNGLSTDILNSDFRFGKAIAEMDVYDRNKAYLVSAEEATVTTRAGRFRANLGEFRRISSELAKGSLDTLLNFVKQWDFGDDGYAATVRAFISQNIEARSRQLDAEGFTEDVMSLDILTAHVHDGGLGLTEGKAREHLRKAYGDFQHDPDGRSYFYETENPVNLENVSKTPHLLAICR